MDKLIEFSVENRTIRVQPTECGSENLKYRGDKETIFNILDTHLDKLIQEEILGQCKILAGSFEKLKGFPVAPKKAVTEFSLSFNTEGNIYIAKLSSQANYKITFEWEI